jgi:hypothetical protein
MRPQLRHLAACFARGLPSALRCLKLEGVGNARRDFPPVTGP